ncbi:unnamed protein product [Schistocephalus solidus]|uniref:Uncharacterized protein n=2 Tax=Schistocephalus solidus TaxID=70667 RepID=A0A183S740_SCHSO|nr:unnamed protein product [Schistocephalus solidus]
MKGRPATLWKPQTRPFLNIADKMFARIIFNCLNTLLERLHPETLDAGSTVETEEKHKRRQYTPVRHPFNSLDLTKANNTENHHGLANLIEIEISKAIYGDGKTVATILQRLPLSTTTEKTAVMNKPTPETDENEIRYNVSGIRITLVNKSAYVEGIDSRNIRVD